MGVTGVEPSQKSLHKKFWVYLFAEMLSMCSLSLLVLCLKQLNDHHS